MTLQVLAIHDFTQLIARFVMIWTRLPELFIVLVNFYVKAIGLQNRHRSNQIYWLGLVYFLFDVHYGASIEKINETALQALSNEEITSIEAYD